MKVNAAIDSATPRGYASGWLWIVCEPSRDVVTMVGEARGAIVAVGSRGRDRKGSIPNLPVRPGNEYGRKCS